MSESHAVPAQGEPARLEARLDELAKGRGRADRAGLLEALPVAVLLLGETGVVVSANRIAGRMLNMPHTALIGKPFVAFVDLPSRSSFRDCWHDVVSGGGRLELAVGLVPRGGPAASARVFLAAPASPFGVRQVYCVAVPAAVPAAVPTPTSQ